MASMTMYAVRGLVRCGRVCQTSRKVVCARLIVTVTVSVQDVVRLDGEDRSIGWILNGLSGEGADVS